MKILISGSFLYKEKYDDIDLFIISKYKKEDYKDGMADTPIAIMPHSGKITLLQMDGEASKEEIKQALEKAKEACKKIREVQVKALKEKYGGMKNEV